MSTIQQQQQPISQQRTTGLPNKDDTLIVDGQRPGDSVSVQSQLATANVQDGNIHSKSNIGQVVNDLSNVHGASNSWLDGESAKVTQWGKAEIERILSKAKLMQEQLVAGAREQQKALDGKHQGELAKLVQQMDLKKAAELKELEDGLQRQIQAALTKSKQDINAIESDMNNRKMELLKQAQLRQAKQIDSLSNLVVETKLVPTQTKTIIETNTNTAPVLAVATGGNISTGSAAAENHSSARLAAVPNAGKLDQAAEVTTGDMIADRSGRKVGEGAIVNTQTNVTQQQRPELEGRQQDITVQARPLHNERPLHKEPLAEKPAVAASAAAAAPLPAQQAVLPKEHATTLGERERLERERLSGLERDRLSGATQRAGAPAPVDAGRTAGTTSGAVLERPDAKSSADPLTKREVDTTTKSEVLHDAKHDGAVVDPALIDSNGNSKVGPDGKHHHKGLLGKMKHALGLEPKEHVHEPKSTDATQAI